MLLHQLSTADRTFFISLSPADSILLYQQSTADCTLLHRPSTPDSTLLHQLYIADTAQRRQSLYTLLEKKKQLRTFLSYRQYL